MKQLYLYIAMMCLGAVALHGQQDPMFTKYMFNSLTFNPAYAGSKPYLSAGVLYRQQWFGGDAIEGAPITQTFTIHTPISDKVGLGMSLVNDEIGPTHTVQGNFSYAYHIPFETGKLSVALQAGVKHWRANWNELNPRELNDAAFENMTPSEWMPNFGAGVYYYTDNWYIGASVPQLINYDLRETETITTNRWAQTYRHYYLTAGLVVPVNNYIDFKPSILVKHVNLFGSFNSDPGVVSTVGAPTAVDIDASFLFYKTIWVGAAFRSALEALNGDSSVSSANVWAMWYFDNGVRLGAAYDYGLNQIQTVSNGSFEVALGYDFNVDVNKVVTPRYF